MSGEYINYLNKKLAAAEYKKEMLKEELEKNKSQEEYWNQKYNNSLKARAIIQEVAKETQQNLEYRVSSIVTTALKSIPFEEDDQYEFLLEFVEKHNKTEAEFWLVKNGEKCKPIDSVGGGVCDIISIGLICTFHTMKPTRPLLILDEPLRNLSADLHSEAGEMLKMLCEELGITILMVSHNKEIIKKADNLINL